MATYFLRRAPAAALHGYRLKPGGPLWPSGSTGKQISAVYLRAPSVKARRGPNGFETCAEWGADAQPERDPPGVCLKEIAERLRSCLRCRVLNYLTLSALGGPHCSRAARTPASNPASLADLLPALTGVLLRSIGRALVSACTIATTTRGFSQTLEADLRDLGSNRDRGLA